MQPPVGPRTTKLLLRPLSRSVPPFRVPIFDHALVDRPAGFVEQDAEEPPVLLLAEQFQGYRLPRQHFLQVLLRGQTFRRILAKHLGRVDPGEADGLRDQQIDGSVSGTWKHARKPDTLQRTGRHPSIVFQSGRQDARER